RPRAGVVVVDGDYGRCLTSERRARWIAESKIESLRPFYIRVINDENRNRLGSLTRGELERAESADVIAARSSHAVGYITVLRASAVAGGVIHTRRATRIT